MKAISYLTFAGDCGEAFDFYRTLFGGKIEAKLTHRDMPPSEYVPAGWEDKVMHVHLTFGGNALMGSDNPPAYYKRPEGLWVSLHVDTPAEAERVFSALAEGGEMRMPLAKTSWAESFGMAVDRFGIPWMVNCPVATS